MNVKNVIIFILRLILLAVLIFLAFNKHSRSKLFTYQSVIWADAAGYNVYLPATFNYHFDARQFPDSIDFKTGEGFQLDLHTGKVQTKYTMGVAFLQAPFYAAAQLLAPSFSMEASGYSQIYASMLYVAGVIYAFLGLLLLYRFLCFRNSRLISAVVVMVIFLGTNLYYYAVESSGMSHVYSFFLFSAFLYLLRSTNFLSQARWWHLLLFGLTAGLIVLIRPTNILFLSSFFILDLESFAAVNWRSRNLISIKVLSWVIPAALVVWLPQMFYWYYLSNHFFFYTYSGEGFNWFDPHFLYTWFAPLNGLFLYTPLWLLILFGCLRLWQQGRNIGLLLIIFFVIISYIFSCWWDWSFGCSLGARSYVEYLALFSIPLASLLSRGAYANKINIFMGFLMIAVIVFNLKIIYSYDMCFFGENAWDWEYYFNLIIGPTK